MLLNFNTLNSLKLAFFKSIAKFIDYISSYPSVCSYCKAHEQLKAVLWTLLEELPSDFPILLLGTCSLPLAELDTDHLSVFPLHNVYVLPNMTPIYFLQKFGVLYLFTAFYMFINNNQPIS